MALHRLLSGVRAESILGYASMRIVGLALLALASCNLSASYTSQTYTSGNNSVKVTIYGPSPVYALKNGSGGCNVALGCGYAEGLANATAPAWHNGRSSGYATDAAFLNSLDSRVSYSLAASAGLHPYDVNAPNASEPWRTPNSDFGYILSTADTSTSSTGIQITGNSAPASGGKTTHYYFTRVSFYWGSVDPWNTIKFTDAYNSASTVTITGNDLKSQGVCVPDPTGKAAGPASCGTTFYNSTDVVVDFNHGGDPWSSIQLLSCTGAQPIFCTPAFEFDNLEYTMTAVTSASASAHYAVQAPIPDPAALVLMGTGIVSIAGWLRRQLRA